MAARTMFLTLPVAVLSTPAPFDAVQFHQRGYVVLRDVLPVSAVMPYAQAIRDAALRSRNHTGAKLQFRRSFTGGLVMTNFRDDPRFSGLFDIINGAPRLHHVLKQILGSSYRFCSHNDIGVNQVVGWHKDRLNFFYRAYERLHPWELTAEGDPMRVVKVAVYLEDHTDPLDLMSLRVQPGSHENSTVNGAQYEASLAVSEFVRCKVGDVLIFDQRITHRGQDKNLQKFRKMLEIYLLHGAGHGHHTLDLRPQSSEFNASLAHGTLLWAKGREMGRAMVSLGYGRNNQHTDDFERGTIMRQDAYNKAEGNYDGYSTAAHRLVRQDLERLAAKDKSWSAATGWRWTHL